MSVDLASGHFQLTAPSREANARKWVSTVFVLLWSELVFVALAGMVEARKARAVGFNHVALEVGDIEEALAFYGRLFDFKLRGKSGTSAFIDLGDQFLALQKGRTQPADEGRHFGLVVDDKDAVRKALADAGIEPLPGPFLDFLDPWGNRIEMSATTISNSPRRQTCCAAWD